MTELFNKERQQFLAADPSWILRTFDSNSVSSDKVCDKVSGKGRLKWDVSGFKMSKLQSVD